MPVPANGDRFNGRERLEHERRGWIFREFTCLTDAEPQFVIVGYEEPTPCQRTQAYISTDFLSS